MILYSHKKLHNKDLVGYCQRYAATSELFPFTSAYLDVLIQICAHVQYNKHFSVLELGCGQGKYLSTFRYILSQHFKIEFPAEEEPELTCIGMDGAWVAIDQADAQFPDLLWVNDTHQSFFLKKETLHKDGILPYKEFDIIIDKGGSTIVSNEEEARNLLENIKNTLKNGGMYIYIISKSFHEGDGKTYIYNTWSKDWIDLAAEVIGGHENKSFGGIYFHIYKPVQDCSTSC